MRHSRLRRRYSESFLAVCLVGSSLSVLPAPSAGATLSPVVEQNCVASPQATTVSQLGRPGAGVGELIRWGTTVNLPPGATYQGALVRPDGSRYFPSFLRLNAPANTALVQSPPDLKLRLGGVEQTLVAGTQPQPGQWVVESTTVAAGSVYTV